ncbi:MAG: 5-deoxy-glucuronate isomerase, partial [Opitutaceae bacterium]
RTVPGIFPQALRRQRPSSVKLFAPVPQLDGQGDLQRGRQHQHGSPCSARTNAASARTSLPRTTTPSGSDTLNSAGAFCPIGSCTCANRTALPPHIKSCQLVLGFTEFELGSIWNTMPPHTHSRRTEIYLYFDLGENIAMHFRGEPQATRHLVVRDREAVLSPAWSVHCGVGTGAYRFVWAIGGDNQVFADMDPAPIATLR